MKQKDVVVGATDNLGANIALHLHQQGYEVIVIGHRQSDNHFFADRGMSYYSVDIEKDEAFSVLPTDDIYAIAHFVSLYRNHITRIPS